MKLSYAISTQETSFDSVAKGDWKAKVKQLAALGYQGVELAIRDPKKLDVQSLAALLQGLKLELAAIGTGQAYLAEGLFLAAEEEKVRTAACQRMAEQIDLAQQFKSRVVIGLIRGCAKRNTDFSMDKLKRSLQEVCSRAEEKNIPVIIEPINRYEVSALNNVAETLELIDQVGSKMLFLMLDTFHMNIEEPKIKESIRKAGDKLAHIHVADSDRWYPGHGHIDFAEIIQTLDEIGYQGYLSGEMMPAPSFDQSVQKTFENMSKLIRNKGAKK